jgi:hypothetical protein
MKKSILIFNALISITCFIISTAQAFISGFTFQLAFLILFGIFGLIAIYNIFENKNVKNWFFILFVINLFQSVSFIFLGITFKFITGPDLTLYLIDASDNFIEFSFKIFNIFTDVSYIKTNQVVALGINLIHLFCSFFFYVQFKSGYVNKE